MNAGLTHLDGRGNARMVDITNKVPTRRQATARCRIVSHTLNLQALAALLADRQGMQDAAVTGMTGAKYTSALIPLCHPIRLAEVSVTLATDGDSIHISAAAITVERTGVEMEALTGCALAGLAVIALANTYGVTASMEDLTLWEKRGGRSGTWQRSPSTVHNATG